jgi:uncharacterized protein involved in exopolysaccharide biosynthesis
MEAARQNLEAQEAKIREFKGQHVSELPTQLESNLQILSGLQSQLQNENAALNAAKQQQVYLETLLREYRTLKGSPKGPEGSLMDVPTINQELDKLKSQLQDLSSRYNDRYPEIRTLKSQIAALEKIREQRLVDQKAKDSNPQAGDKSGVPAEDSADTRSQPQLLQLQSQLHSNQTEIANHEQMIAALKSRVDDYQARLNQEPVREQQLADLTRGYDQSKATYDDLLKKKNQSAMATSMELLQQGERFRIIDPPNLPVKPSFPNRLKFCGIGLIVGLALGVGLAGAFEFMDDRVHDERQLKKLLPVVAFAEIPIIASPTNDKAELKKVWFGWAAAAATFATILAGSAISYLAG